MHQVCAAILAVWLALAPSLALAQAPITPVELRREGEATVCLLVQRGNDGDLELPADTCIFRGALRLDGAGKSQAADTRWNGGKTSARITGFAPGCTVEWRPLAAATPTH